MTSYGSDIFSQSLHAKNVHVKDGTIYWDPDAPSGGFQPPLEQAGVDTLAATLTAGNDAEQQEIQNCGGISISTDGVKRDPDPGHISGATVVQCNQLTSTFATSLEVQVGDDLSLGNAGASGGTITFNSQASQGACSITGPSSTNRCVVSNCDFTSASNTFPTSIDDDTLADVLARGNSAGSTGINMNSQDISGFGQLLAGGASAVQLGPTQMFGVLNMEAADATKHNITNANTIGAQAVGAVQISASGSLSATNISGRDINLNGIIGDAAKLDFTGVAGQGQLTEIEGDDSLKDGVAQLTKCTYLDLSDGSNKLVLPSIEQYEWGAYILPTTLTAVESQDEDWKDFGTEVYAETTATTETGHNKQLIKLQFNVVKWSFGNIMIGLDISDSDGSNKVELHSGICWMTKFDPKGIQTTDRQKPGLCVMSLYVDSATLKDGNQHRIYPKVKTDTSSAPGEIRIAWGPGIDTNDNQSELIGAVLIEGKPEPKTFRTYLT